MLQTLATTGIITNMFMHEIRTSTNNIGLELNAAYEAIEYDNDMAYALQNILRAIRVKKILRHGLVLPLNLSRKTNEREEGIIFKLCWNNIFVRGGIFWIKAVLIYSMDAILILNFGALSLTLKILLVI